MGCEIERKFLVADVAAALAGAAGVHMAQGYLSTAPERTVRVRLAGERATLAVKGLTAGLSRPEFEYSIPTQDAAALLELCERPVLEKTRHRVSWAGRTWEVDVFHGMNEGLVTAEVELTCADEQVDLPPWLGAEVSHDPRYFNSNLARNPFGAWR